MLIKPNAPAREGEGVVCLLGGDNDASTTARPSLQRLRIIETHLGNLGEWLREHGEPRP